MKYPESKLQQSCVKWFRLQYREYDRLLFAIPNGGSRNIVTARILQAEGVRAGTSDLMLALPNRVYSGVFIEMKTGNNKQTPEQIAFQQSVEKVGYQYIVIRSFDEFFIFVNSYLTQT